MFSTSIYFKIVCVHTANKITDFMYNMWIFFFIKTEVLAITQKISEGTFAFHENPNVFQEIKEFFC